MWKSRLRSQKKQFTKGYFDDLECKRWAEQYAQKYGVKISLRKAQLEKYVKYSKSEQLVCHYSTYML